MNKLFFGILIPIVLFCTTSYTQFVNGDFESGRFSGWTEYSSHDWTVIGAVEHQAAWNAENVPSGVYFYRLQAGKYSETKKLLLQR